MQNILSIVYDFSFEDGTRESFTVNMNKKTIEIVPDQEASAPEWTRLVNNKCRHCPLKETRHPHCPLALSLTILVSRLGHVLSYEKVRAEATLGEKTVRRDTTAQKAVSSLMGLIIPASGCPHAAWFRPMARFHVPFASIEETGYRAAAMYMLAQYFLHKRGRSADFTFDGLNRIYKDIAIVNRHMAERLREASPEDASVNALVILDLFAKAIPFSLADSLKGLEPLFAPYLDGKDS